MATPIQELIGSPHPSISVILPVLNEQSHLESSVRSVLSQDYKGPIEVILAIGPSKDRTLEIAKRIASSDSRVVLVENPTGKTATGLNLALGQIMNPVVVRVDAHAEIPQNYLSLIVEVLNKTGAVNVGGVMAAVGKTVFEKSVAGAMRSAFGVGASSFHTGGEAGPVDTVYLGAFRREALIAIGGFDERFTRAQDWELNFRLRENGGVIYFDPRLHVTYRPRSTVRALAKQYFEYGRWRRVVSRRHKGTINYRYLAPPVALVGFLASVILGLLLSPILFIPASIYALFILGASIKISSSIREFFLLLLVLPTMHFAWGAGFISSPKTLVPSSE
ncbi:MAG: glycosyltransferase family 2 protein [Candidatus Planktophila sp.]|nr:glycosyltransferase family 2 protein [Candidatus Planktophila sp.]MSO24548.1 glycosyltransferase family 2 protein [Candidatus Planktophila sp.]PHX70046.1 MAG: glycosyl transferase family 2 [Actinomycetota bacterium]